MEMICRICGNTIRVKDELTAIAAGWTDDEHRHWTCGLCLAERAEVSATAIAAAGMKLAPEGYAAIASHVETMEAVVKEGIVDPEKSQECCRKLRMELYGILKTLRDVCLLSPGTAESELT